MKNYLVIRLLLLLGLILPMKWADAQTYAPLGVFAGGVDTSTWWSDYSAFTGTMGQAASSTDCFIDYTSPFRRATQYAPDWVSSAGYNAEKLAADISTNHLAPIIPIVSVGLVDTAHAYVSGTYNESNATTAMYAVAAGSYDDVFQGVINAFQANGFTKIYLRIGWEQNGNWYGWQATKDSGQAAAYVAAWQHVANLAHNLVPAYPINAGLTVQTVWCPCLSNWEAVAIGTTYPGDTYVDIVGPDFYSPTWATDFYDWDTAELDPSYTFKATNPINREHYWDYPSENQWNYTTTPRGGYGMVDAIAFAVAHAKPFGISECGAGGDGGDRGPVDEAQFPYWLANRLSSATEQGLTIPFVCIWDVNASGTWDFSDGSKPTEAIAWNAFTGTMAATVPVSEPFGVDYAIGTASSTAGSGTGPDTLVGSGTGYVANSTADNFNFIALPLEGDGSFVLQLTSQSISTGQTGVMLRGGMRPGDPYAVVYVSGTKATFISRTASGGTSVQNSQVTAHSAPWLKIQRMGATVLGFQSGDGKTWTYVGSQVIPTLSNAYVGAAISSGSTLNNSAVVNYVNLPNDVIVDDTTATKTGTWTTKTQATYGYGGSYLTDNNANKTTPCTVAYTPNLAVAGNYDIYAWYTPGSTSGGTPTRANNIPLTITNTSGSTSLVVDETTGSAAHWNYVGTASLVAGTGNTVTLSNLGTTSTVVADSLMFVLNPAPAGAEIGSVAPTPTAVNLAPAGIVDWGHWGGTTSNPSSAWDHATLSTPLISNWTAIGTGWYAGSASPTTYSWTGSAGANPTATNGARCVYCQGVGEGYQLTVTTGTVPQILNVYAGAQWVVTSQIQVLNSASQVIYTNSAAINSSTRLDSDYALSLEPNSTYTIKYTMTAGTGNIDLEAATLTNAPY